MSLISIILKIHCHSQSLTLSLSLALTVSLLDAFTLHCTWFWALGYSVAFRVYLSLCVYESLYVSPIKSKHSTHWVDSIPHWINKTYIYILHNGSTSVTIRFFYLFFFYVYLIHLLTRSRSTNSHNVQIVQCSKKHRIEYVKYNHNNRSCTILFWKLFDKIAILIKFRTSYTLVYCFNFVRLMWCDPNQMSKLSANI